MHDFCGMVNVSWKDKKLTILLSTHTILIDMHRESKSHIPRKNGAIHELVYTSPMHLEYISYMEGGCGQSIDSLLFISNLVSQMVH